MTLREELSIKRERLVAMRNDYEQAKALIISPAWTARSMKVLDRLREILTGPITRPAEHVLGMAREALRPLEEPQDLIAQYQGLRDGIDRLERSIASRSEAAAHNAGPFAENELDRPI